MSSDNFISFVVPEVVDDYIKKTQCKNEKEIITVFPDDNKKYLTTELSKNLSSNKEFISNQIELIDYEFV